MIDPNRARGGRTQSVRLTLVEILVVAALAMALAFPSWAEAAEAAEAGGSGEADEAVAEATGPEYVPCSELGRLKYPFLRCVRGPSGRPVLADEGPGMSGARLKLHDSFVSGGGGWGSSGIE